ncbi:hypothetical protein BGW39_007972 [Mortierella sp. 14UC]|nr:hypothetical protein BGW39_007972 [Mortierella sp. 14UC]
MSMATAIEHLQEPTAEDTLTGTTTPGKGKAVHTAAAATTETQLSVEQGHGAGTTTGAATGAAADVSDNNDGDDERSIEFVTSEPDTTTTATENVTMATAAPPVPFEGDGADPAQPVPPRSTFDWLAYTVSLNYNRLATSVFSPITHWHWFDTIPNTSIILGAVPSQHLLVQLQRDYAVQDIVNMCAEFKGHLQTMKELGLVQSGRGRSATVVLCWLVYCYKLTALEAQAILLKARGQVDKNVYLHSEVISFYEQVLDQEKNGAIERKVWPDHTGHVNSGEEGEGGTGEVRGGV